MSLRCRLGLHAWSQTFTAPLLYSALTRQRLAVPAQLYRCCGRCGRWQVGHGLGARRGWHDARNPLRARVVRLVYRGQPLD